MFLSKLCEVVISFETTYAWTGCCDWPPIAFASWFVPEEPTALKSGGIDGIVGAEPKLGADGAPPPPDGADLPANVGTFVFVIAFTCAKPEAIAAPAAAKPKAGPIIGIGASEA